MLKNSEVSVISGNGAKELSLVEFKPRCTAENALCNALCDIIIHKGETCTRTDDNVFGINAHKLGKKLLTARNTIKDTVISHIDTVFNIVDWFEHIH